VHAAHYIIGRGPLTVVRERSFKPVSPSGKEEQLAMAHSHSGSISFVVSISRSRGFFTISTDIAGMLICILGRRDPISRLVYRVQLDRCRSK